MDFIQWLQITGTVVAIIVGILAVWNSGKNKRDSESKIDLLQNNHLSGLTARIDELERQREAIWGKHDLLDKKLDEVIVKLERLDQYVKIKLNGSGLKQ